MPYFSYTQIQIGPVVFYTWGLLLGLAFFISSWLFLREAAKKEIDQKKIFWLIFFVFFGGVVGSRFGYVLQFSNYYLSHFEEIFHIWTGGLMFYGGLLGALAVGWIYLKKSKLDFWEIADLAVPALALGIFITRIGCSLINDHQGAITSLPWAIQWPDGSWRHPVAEYLALNALIMLLVLSRLRNRFIIFLFWYPLVRLLLDFTRASDTLLADPHYLNLTISQWISLSILTVYVIILICKKLGIVFPLKRRFRN